MSLWVRKATIAIEDRRFFEHGGVDVEGIARAAVDDVRAGEIVEGGSTITQQLVRNLYISRERTVQRKVKEACLATKLDRAWTKQRILTTYLNQVYYGNQRVRHRGGARRRTSPSRRSDLDALRVRAARRAHPGALDLRSVHRARRAPSRGGRRCCARCSRRASSRRASIARPSTRSSRCAAVSSTTQIREPYFFGYVRDRLIEVYGAAARSGPAA